MQGYDLRENFAASSLYMSEHCFGASETLHGLERSSDENYHMETAAAESVVFGGLARLHTRKNFAGGASPSHEVTAEKSHDQRMSVAAFVGVVAEAYCCSEPSYLAHDCVNEYDHVLDRRSRSRRRSWTYHCFPAHSTKADREAEVAVVY